MLRLSLVFTATLSLLRHRAARGVHVHCRKGDSRRDYYCVFSGGNITGSPADTYGYNVNETDVNEQSG